MTTRERGDSFGDLIPHGIFDGYVVVTNDEGKAGIIPPTGADIADAPTAAILLCLELEKEPLPMTEEETAKIRAERMLRHFQHDHLPTELAVVSAPFGDLAYKVVRMLPQGPERTVCLRKLLEAKDCAVRAYLEGKDAEDTIEVTLHVGPPTDD